MHIQPAIEMIIIPILIKAKCVHALIGLALPYASNSSEIVLSGSCRQRSTLGAVPVLFVHTIVAEIKTNKIISLSLHATG